MGRFIDPRVDWAFKRIFGCDDTKECLITFLNGVFEGELVIKNVKFEKTEQPRYHTEERGVIFDVYCTTDDGRHVIVEMQKREQKFFADRALYYSAKAIVKQEKKGPWDFQLSPVYTVCFMDFVAKQGLPHRFRSDFGLRCLQEERTRQEKLRIVYLQLPLFEKHSEAECEDNIFDCWIYILKNLNYMEQMPFLQKYPIFRKLAEITDIRKLTPKEQEQYDEDLKVMRDIYNTEMFAQEQIEEARAEAKKAQEKAQKAQEEAQKRTSKTVSNLLKMGFTHEQIADVTGISIEEIKEIASKTISQL